MSDVVPAADSPTRFKPYPAYKDSGVEWLGEIPAHWEVKRLWHLTPASRRIMYGIVLPGPNVEDGVPIVKGGDISAERLRLNRLNRTTFEIESGYVRSRLRGGDLVYAIRGSIGEVAIVPDELQGANLTQDAARVAYTAATHGSWLLHALKSVAVFAQLEAGALGATIRGVNIRDLKRASLPVPPRFEQELIARFLERETARIDALVTKKERLIELLQEKRTALITRAVTKGLPAEAAAKAGLDPNVPMKDSGVEWLGEIPEHWEVRRLRDLSPSLGVGVVVNPSEYVADDGLPFLYGSDVSEGRILAEQARRISLEDSQRLPKSQLHAGDLVMVRVGAPGVTAVVPLELEGANCASILVIRRGSRFDSGWLCYVLNSRTVRSQVEIVQYGAAQEQFNVSHAVNFLVAVSPITEQQRIAAFLDRETAKIDAFVAKVRDAIDRLKELRTALISAAVTGKIDVRGEIATAA